MLKTTISRIKDLFIKINPKKYTLVKSEFDYKYWTDIFSGYRKPRTYFEGYFIKLIFHNKESGVFRIRYVGPDTDVDKLLIDTYNRYGVVVELPENLLSLTDCWMLIDK